MVNTYLPQEFFTLYSEDNINTLLCPIICNSNTIELTVHTSCYCLELNLCY